MWHCLFLCCVFLSLLSARYTSLMRFKWEKFYTFSVTSQCTQFNLRVVNGYKNRVSSGVITYTLNTRKKRSRLTPTIRRNTQFHQKKTVIKSNYFFLLAFYPFYLIVVFALLIVKVNVKTLIWVFIVAKGKYFLKINNIRVRILYKWVYDVDLKILFKLHNRFTCLLQSIRD